VKLHGLTLEVLNRAVSVYWGKAYGDSDAMPNFSNEGESSSEVVLALFQKNVVEAAGEQCARYTIRLGNRNYPFMKLVFQEHLITGEYFFAVDTHDEMDIKPDYPDYEAWMSVLRFNQGLKRDIEVAFASEGLDTSACIRKMATDRVAGEGPCRDLSILVVDDEEDLAETMEALLSARGFRIYKVHDGLTALSAAQRLHPDLVLLDYELPEMDGLEVISALRSDPATAGIRILLATASQVTMAEISQADGFLAKPFHEKLLYEVVERILGIREEADG
jgi:CheY-like chemotaxis protein